MTGPTVAGSITAKLRLDDSDWVAKLAAAKAQAEDLGRSDPHIRVDVDSAGAIAQMAEVKAAEDVLGGSAGKTTAAFKRQNDTNASGITRWKLIAAAIAALIPLLAPLAGYAVGVAGALAGMGAAGVLAVIGIKQAMEQGTAAGQVYSSGLQTLKGDMNGLAATSASAMLSSFQQAVRLINQDMPNLNGQIATFSQMLGRIGTTLLSGVLNSFKVLNPLFVQAGEYVQDLADGFKQWTENGGLKRFADYAQQALPQVAQTLGSLASAIMHVVEATAPIGSVTLGILTAFGDAINAIPTPALTAVVVAAGAVFIAVKAWNGLTPIVTGLSNSMTGLKGSALGAAGAIAGIAVVADSAALAGMSSAMKGVNDAFGQTRSVNEYSKAIADGNINMDKLGQHLQVAGGWFNDFSKNVQNATGGYNVAYGELGKLDQALAAATPKDLIAGYKQLQAEGKKTGKSAEDMANLFPLATAAFNSVKGSAGGAGDKIAGIGTSAETASGKIDALAQKLAGFGSTALAESQAQIAYKQSIDSATASIAQNGATLDLSTQQGRSNQSALDAIASSTMSLISSQNANHDSTETLTASMTNGRAAFIAAAEAAGLTAEQANNLADQYGLIPHNVDTAVAVTGATDAVRAAESVAQALANIPTSREVSVSVHGQIVTPGGQLESFSHGGTVPAYRAAGGAIDTAYLAAGSFFKPQGTDTVPAMLTPGEFVIKEKAASYDPAFLKAYNSDPASALAGRGSNSLTGLVITGMLDMGNGLTGMLRGFIQQELTQQGTALANGVRPLA